MEAERVSGGVGEDEAEVREFLLDLRERVGGGEEDDDEEGYGNEDY